MSSSQAPVPRGHSFQALLLTVPYLVLLLGLGGTIWAWWALTNQNRDDRTGRLEVAQALTRAAVEHTFESRERLLQGAQSFFVDRPKPTAEAWRVFAASLELDRTAPGTRLFGYIPLAVLGGREGSAPFLEPEAQARSLGTGAAWLLKQPAFQEAALRALDQGSSALSARMVLPEESAPVLLLLQPVPVRSGSPGRPARPARDQQAYQGFLVGVLDPADMFRSLYGPSPIADLDVELFDGPVAQEDHLVYDRDLCLRTHGPLMGLRPQSRLIPVELGGRTWTLAVGFMRNVPRVDLLGRASLVAIGGALLTLLAFGVTLFLSHSRSQLEELARRVQESEARFRSVAETASCAIFIYSECIEYINECGSRITGYPQDEIVGAPLTKLVHPMDQDLVRNRGKARLRGESVPISYEFRVLTKSGETRWIEFSAGTVVLGGRLMGIGTAFDVTDRVLANEARLRVERKLFEAQRLESLGLLAGGVAHDFNNLLTVIQGNAGMIRDAEGDPELAQGCLRNIEDTCRRASDLVRQMLAYSGRGKVLVQALELNHLVREIAQLLSVSIPKTVTLRYALAEDLPLAAGDVAQVQQVVMNLVTNAAEAIGTMEGIITLRSGVRRMDATDIAGLRVAEEMQPGLFAYLEVEDNGSGMDAETQARIFDPFFTTKFTGRGLGLAAMQGIVRGHGGGVEIHSSLGVGTIFRIYLPAQGPADLPRSVVLKPRDEAWRGSGLAVVADDEPGIRDFARHVLERAGFEVLLAVDGVEAVEHVRAHRDELCLVMLDLTMPRMGGEDALGEIRRLGYKGPALLWSGYAHSEIAGAGSTFLQKPFSADELLDKVQAGLRR